ncbi:MAG: zinc ribbon domain-containing protein [Candidatus Neomarinimicrobiota bacterium]
MPTYSYVCDTCGHRFDEMQSMKAEPLKICPDCGQEQLRRVISGGAGLIFKGSGFYITDYVRDKEGEGGGKKKAETETKAKDGAKAKEKDTAGAAKEKKEAKGTKEKH